MGEVKVLKGGSELSPEQQEFVKELRALLDRALAGEVRGLFGVAYSHDEDDDTGHEPVLMGTTDDVGDLMRRLGHLTALVDSLDGESWLAEDDEE